MPAEKLTDRDIERVVDSLCKVTVEHPRMTFPQRYMRAQHVLPRDKQYDITVVYQRNKWTQRLQNAIKDAGLWPGMPAPQKEVIPFGEPVKQVEPPPVVESTPQAVVQPPVESPDSKELLSQLYTQVREEIREEIRQMIDASVKTHLTLLLENTDRRDASISPEEREEIVSIVERKNQKVSAPRFFIIGLIPPQIVILRQKLSDLNAEIRFWKDEAQTKLYDGIAWADEIIIMSKFVSHSTIHIVSKKARDKMKYCNGAVSDLDRQIRSLHRQRIVEDVQNIRYG